MNILSFIINLIGIGEGLERVLNNNDMIKGHLHGD